MSAVDIEDLLNEDFPFEQRTVRLERKVDEAQSVEVIWLQDQVQFRGPQPVGRLRQLRVETFGAPLENINTSVPPRVAKLA